MEIQSSFKANEKIWGTFKKFRERTKAVKTLKGRSRNISVTDQSIGTLLLKHGNLIFIRPESDSLKTVLKVNSLPYHKLGKQRFIVKSKKSDKDLYKLYKTRLKRFINRNPEFAEHLYKFENSDIDFGDLDCRRIKKFIHCKIPIIIRPEQLGSKRKSNKA